MATAEELSELTVDELRGRASDADVEGRSSMTKDELVDALAEDTDTATVDVDDGDAPEHQQAVNAGRTGIDEGLTEAKAQARAAEEEADRPFRPGDRTVDVVGADAFEEARAETRKIEGQSVDVREGPAPDEA